MTSIKSNFLLLPLLLIILVTGCSQETQITSSLYWEISDPESEGIDPQALDSIHQDIVGGRYGLIDHFLVIRNSKIVFDHHYMQDYETISKKYDTTNHQYNYDHPSWHPYYHGSDLHSLQSVTKSVTSILLGIAKDEGLAVHLDSAVLTLFKDYELDLTDKMKRAITLKDLLTMQSGIQWDESSSYADDQSNNCTIMERSDDWIQYVLNQPMDTVPGTKFVYNSGVSVLIGKIVGILTGKRIDKWAEEKLFEPLGITNYYWKETPQGEIDSEGGLYLSSYDLAKIGYMMLNNGVWEGKQIVSKSWVEESIQPIVKLNERVGYGYQWWVPSHEGDQPEIFAGNGYGGQFVMMAPKYNMLVVFNGWNIHGPAEKSSWNAFQQRIIPYTRVTN